jgi:hypothetical protein
VRSDPVVITGISLNTSKSKGLQRNSLLSITGNFYERTGNLCAKSREYEPDIVHIFPDDIVGRDRCLPQCDFQLATKQTRLGVKSGRATSATNISIECRIRKQAMVVLRPHASGNDTYATTANRVQY